MLTNSTETPLRLVSLLLQLRTSLNAAIGRIEAICAELDAPQPPTYTPREHRLLLENEAGTCPVCGRLRGFSVPDDCADNVACPEPEDLERLLRP